MREVLDDAEYELFTSAPFEIPHNARLRSALLNILAERESQEPGLFGQPSVASELLAEMEVAHENGQLYRRWTQEIDGKMRDLSVPSPPLRRFLVEYLEPLVSAVPTHPSCHGGEPGWSPYGSVKTHLPADTVLTFDIQSAFPNCPFDRVFDAWLRALPSTEEARHLAGFLSFLSTVHYKGMKKRGLPVGSPNAANVFNRALRPMDDDLSAVAAEKGIKYSRWIDDIALSAPDHRTAEQLMGAIDLASRHMPVAPNKVFFQQAPGSIYLIGQIIENGRVIKNSREEVRARKVAPIKIEDWIGSEATRSYESWKHYH